MLLFLYSWSYPEKFSLLRSS